MGLSWIDSEVFASHSTQTITETFFPVTRLASSGGLELDLDVEASVGGKIVPDRVPLQRDVGQAEYAAQPVLRHLGAVVADLSVVQRRHQQLHTPSAQAQLMHSAVETLHCVVTTP